MAKTNILMHLPRLRLEGDEPFPVGFGSLVKLSWASYNSLTLGAFSDWQQLHDQTDPVFLHVIDDFDLPFVNEGVCEAGSFAEIKVSDQLWEHLPSLIGHRVINAAHDVFADLVWAALMLAAPSAAPGQPRSSVTFLVPEGDHHIELHGKTHEGIRVQGQADQEFVFAPLIASPFVSRDQLVAADYLTVAREAREDAALGPALRVLLSTTGAVLSPAERLVLAVSGLEGLLLAEVRTGHQDVLAERIRALLGDEAEPVARQLYRARSSAVHDGPDGSVAGPTDAVAAEQLLADVIVAAHGRGDSFDPEELAPGTSPFRTSVGTAAYERLHPREDWWSNTMTSGVNLASAEGQLASWSPLIGLAYAGEVSRLGELNVALLPFSPAEILSMEHQDIRRELRELSFIPTSYAGLGVFVPRRTLIGTVPADLLADLLRPRDLAVVGLRLGGFRTFTDPELLGWYVYDGNDRYRRETVFGQTALMGLASETEELTDQLTERSLTDLEPVMTLLARYDQRERSEELERIFGLFRRAHDTAYTLPETRATLLFATLEMMLGRFRPPADKVQLEDLVARLSGLQPDVASWFAERGRSLRNEVAHGTWRPDPENPSVADLDRLCDIVAAALIERLQTLDSKAS